MKIAMIGQKGIAGERGGGGVERHVENVSRQLSMRGYDVTVYARSWYQKSSATATDKVLLAILPSLRTKHFDTISHTFLATIHALWKGFDVYHYHGVGPALLSFLPRVFRPQARVIVTFHCIDRLHKKWNSFAQAILRLGERAACRFPHVTIAVSAELAAYCWEQYHRLAIIVPNGIDPAIADFRMTDSGILERFEVKPKQYFLIVSRFVRHKRVHDAIEAYRVLVANGTINPSATPLLVVGSGAFTQEYEREIRLLADRTPGVIVTGGLASGVVFALMRNARLSIHPSENEGMSLSLLEAVACGAPVVVSDIPEHRILVGGFGHTFHVGEPAHLAQRIATILHDTESLQNRADLGQRHVIRIYPWSRIAKRVSDAYELSHATSGAEARSLDLIPRNI